MKGLNQKGLGMVLVAALCLPFTSLKAQEIQDYARMTEHTLMGTARYVGMSGAMSAIGGDPCAVYDNPAGLGLYRRAEVLLTIDYMLDRTRPTEGVISRRQMLMLPQASLVMTMPSSSDSEEGILTHNFMLSYQRLHSFNRTFDITGAGGPSLGSVIAATDVPFGKNVATGEIKDSHLILQESGYVNQYAFDWSMNISNRWYVGLGFRLQSYRLTSDAEYYETFYQFNIDRNNYYNRNQTSYLMTGVGGSVSVGVIYRPLSWLRLGFGLETPSLASLHGSSAGVLSSLRDTVWSSATRNSNFDANDFHRPLHTSTSVAFQIGYYGLIALQYDYYHHLSSRDNHSLRIGCEVIPIPGMYINAGYAYESSFNRTYPPVPVDPTLDRLDAYYQYTRWNQYASVALGYRGKHVIVQAAYQYHWQGVNLYAHEAAQANRVNTDTHRIVLTVGWHRY